MTVEKQDIGDGRFNVLAYSKGTPRLLLAGHMDTVDPKQGWLFDQYEGVMKDGNIMEPSLKEMMKVTFGQNLSEIERMLKKEEKK